MALTPDLLHDADLGVFKRFVLALFAWLSEYAPAAADELDRRLHILTRRPLPCIRRFGPGGFRGLSRKEGAHYRSLMTVLPLALLNLPNIDVDNALILAAEWVDIYAVLRRKKISETQLDAWQTRASTFGARMRDYLVEVGSGNGVFPKLHVLLGGHVHQSVRLFGTAPGYDSAPFEAGHRSTVKRPSKEASHAVDPIAQMAMHVRRAEVVQELGDVAAASFGRTTDQCDDADESGAADALSWRTVPGRARLPRPTLADLVILEAWPNCGELSTVQTSRLRSQTAQWLAEQSNGQINGSAALGARVELMRRLTTRDKHHAYAHPSFRGERRFDDIAVLGKAGATWYARVVGLARFSFPVRQGGAGSVDGVLVRWYERAPEATLRLHGAGRCVQTALAPCPLVYLDALDWIKPEQALRRVGVAPCWQMDAPAAGNQQSRQFVFVNEFYYKLAEDGSGLEIELDEEDEEDKEDEEDEE